MATRAIQMVLTVVVVALILLIAPTILGPVVGQADEAAGGPSFEDAQVRLDGTGFFDVGDGDELGRNETVFLTRGNAVELTGASDSKVQSNSDLTLAGGDTWTVATWAEVNSSVSGTEHTAISANGRVLIQYNDTAGNWSAWYNDEAARNTYQIEMDAPNQPGNLSHIAVVHDGSELSMYRNNTLGPETANTTQSSTEDPELNASNWWGTIEETRVFNESLNNSQRSAIVNAPVQPLSNASRTARMMYDEGRGSSTFIIFADTDATISNGTFVDGFPEVQLSAANDYDWDEDGPRIKAQSGGELADAPIVYIDYFAQTTATQLTKDIAGVISFAGLILALLIAGTILGVVNRLSD